MTNPENSNDVYGSAPEDVKQGVLSLLAQHGVAIECWGKGSAKTLDHLIEEILHGETVLEVEESGTLVRKVSIAYIDIYYVDGIDKRLKLAEERQIFKDGRERRRTLEGSIAEKLKAGEVPDQNMAHRAIQEELGIEGDVIIQPKGARTMTHDSPSYPGLAMKAAHYYFEAELTGGQYDPRGYVEHQKDKDTYFAWQAQ